MKTTRIVAFAILLASFASPSAWAWDQDPFGQYIQRKDTVTLQAGDAKSVNAATHVIDPWPRYVGNRHIPVSGDRLSRAVNRYNQGSYRQPAPPLAPYLGISGGGGGGGEAEAEGHNNRQPMFVWWFDSWLTRTRKIRWSGGQSAHSGQRPRNPIGRQHRRSPRTTVAFSGRWRWCTVGDAQRQSTVARVTHYNPADQHLVR